MKDYNKLVCLIALSILAMTFLGCAEMSIWQVERYYSPKSDSGNYSRGLRSGSSPLIYTYDGMPDRVEINKDVFKLTVRIQNGEDYPISIGPGPLPIIPVFFLNLIPRQKQKDDSLILILNFEVYEIISFDVSKVTVTSASGKEMYALSHIEPNAPFLSKTEATLIPAFVGPWYRHIELKYDVQLSTIDELYVLIEGVSYKGNPIDIPKIFFSPAYDTVITLIH